VATNLHNLHDSWKKYHYGRTKRNQRKLNEAAKGCSKITDYYTVLNKLQLLIQENEELKKNLEQAMSAALKVESTQTPPKLSFMLELLLQSAKKNAMKKTGGERYDEVIKALGHILFHVGGLQLYEILCKNLPFPSVSTIRRMIYKQNSITEGVFRIKQLKTFLEQRNLPLKVHLSEDVTVVAQRVQYHPGSNQIVGFSLPLDENGLPVVGSFPATSANTISSYFKGDFSVTEYLFA